ncbi:MAG: DUF3301 domain-containing protein [Gammaproteobacteria bacterium]|nr:DUF3301 domain-containing protein [Gammaproteobacteria bacterium]
MNSLHWFWFFVLAALAGRAWHTGLQAREAAVRFADQACRLRRLQLLDQTVALKRMRLEREPGRRLPALVRIYDFAFSDNGLTRQEGQLAMRGMRVLQLRLPEPASPPIPEPPLREPPLDIPDYKQPGNVVVPFRRPQR